MLRLFPVAAAITLLATPVSAADVLSVVDVANGAGPGGKSSTAAPPSAGMAVGRVAAVPALASFPRTFRVAAASPFYIFLYVDGHYPSVSLSGCSVTLRLSENGFRYARYLQAVRTTGTGSFETAGEPPIVGKHYLLPNIQLPDGLRPAGATRVPTSISCDGFSPPDVELIFTP